MSKHRDGPWLKVTFDPSFPGTAKVIKAGTAWSKRPKYVSTPGRWVVFDKNVGLGATYYDAETFEECSRFIDGAHTHKINPEHFANIAELRLQEGCQ